MEIIINAVCVLVIFVLLLGLFLQRKAKDKTKRCFLYVLISILIFLICNMGSEIVEGKAKIEFLAYFFNLMTFLTIDALAIAFCNYLFAFLENDGYSNKFLKPIVLITTLARVIAIFILLFTGNLFRIENGCYVEEDLAIIAYAFSLAVMIEYILVLIIEHKHFTVRQIVVVAVYEFLPIVPIALEYVANVYLLLPVSLTLSILIIYVLMQDTTIEESKLKAELLEEISSKDLLTDLNNRRSYYNYIGLLGDDENVGVIFCDINGLKYTNDHFGHAAGDALIQTFAKILVTSIGKESVFRISGDEFVAIIRDSTNDLFNSKVIHLSSKIKLNDNIAAMGFAFGKGCCYNKLVSDAESKMYEDKKTSGSNRNTERHN